MGGQTSRTRKVTFENEEPTNVIKVSDAVVNRLRGAEEAKKSAAAQQTPVQPAATVVTAPPINQPTPFYHYEPSLTSLQVRQEAVEDLRKNDEFWAKRIYEIEKSYQKMKTAMDEEFKKAVEETRSKNTKEGGKGDAPCLINRENVLACYQKYPNEPMRCAKEVQAFTACVDARRVNMVENVTLPMKT